MTALLPPRALQVYTLQCNGARGPRLVATSNPGYYAVSMAAVLLGFGEYARIFKTQKEFVSNVEMTGALELPHRVESTDMAYCFRPSHTVQPACAFMKA